MLFALCLMTLSVSAQNVAKDSTNKEYKNLISLDAMSLLTKFVNTGDLPVSWYAPYQLQYKRYFGKNALRAGVGINSSQTHNYTSFLDTVDYTSSIFSGVLGVGYERQVNLSKRWQLYYGADFFGEYEYTYTRQEYVPSYQVYRQKITGYGYGISPLLGIAFNINKRLSLGTEASYDVEYKTTKEARSSTGDPTYDQIHKTQQFLLNFHAPTAINFRVKF